MQLRMMKDETLSGFDLIYLLQMIKENLVLNQYLIFCTCKKNYLISEKFSHAYTTHILILINEITTYLSENTNISL